MTRRFLLMKRMPLAVVLTVLVACFGNVAGRAQKVVAWDSPAVEQGVYGDGYFTPAIDVNKVELGEDETRVYLSVHLRNNYDFKVRFAAITHLRAGVKTYALLSADGIETDKSTPTNPKLDNRLDVVFHFEPLPQGTVSFDFIEGDESGAFRIEGIQPVEARWDVLFPSYWRNGQTGDWTIAFFDEFALYQCKFWTYVRRHVDPKTEKARMTLRNGAEELEVTVGKNRKGRRAIRIGREKATYSMLTDRFMPAYPVKDTRTGFVDNGNKPDTVTVVGWLKDMPEVYRKDKTISFEHTDVFADKSVRTYADLDEQGRFTMKIPVFNTCEFFCDWGRTYVRTVFEPGKTYFMLFDFKEGRRLFMGDDVCLQNELFRFPLDWNTVEMEQGGDYGRYISASDSLIRTQYAHIDSICVANPSLSACFGIYRKENTLWQQANAFGQSRFRAEGFRMSDAARRYAYDTFWTKLSDPFSRHRETFGFIRDYFADVEHSVAPAGLDIREHLAEIASDDAELALLMRWKAVADSVESLLKDAETEEEKMRIATESELCHEDLSKSVSVIFSSPKAQKFFRTMTTLSKLQSDAVLLDSLNALPSVRDFVACEVVGDNIEWSYRPVSPEVLDTLRSMVGNPWALDRIVRENERYLAIENREFDRVVLKPSDDLEGIAEGEALLEKLLEPYKGKFVLLDIWGTWCGACKDALSHSTEEYAQLADFDIAYLYLANHSPKESWENVIKAHNVSGPNVAHYNLPDDQQQTIERYLQVNAFPTYKLFDREGNLLDVDINIRNLGRLRELFEKLSVQ